MEEGRHMRNLLVFFVLYIGFVKLFPIDKEIHTFMRKEFAKVVKLLPTAYIGYPIKASYFRLATGLTEIIAAFVLGFISNKRCKNSAISVLMISMGLCFYTQVMTGHYWRMFCPLVILILLQVQRKYVKFQPMIQEDPWEVLNRLGRRVPIFDPRILENLPAHEPDNPLRF